MPSFADSYVDTFSNGIDTLYWAIQSNDTLYHIDDTHGDVRFSRSPGGTHVLNKLHLRFLPVVQGNFDVKVDFSNAYINRINGSPGNQVQLNSQFGGQTFCVVRSDEINFGHNYHVWIDPPGQWRGYQANTATMGTLRIVRIDSLVSGYFDSTLVFSGVFNKSNLMHFVFCLQNNGTIDSTSVIFDNFSIIADSIQQFPSGLRDSENKITSCILHQNYPNPFNPSTTIEFDLPKTTEVTLKIFNILGEEVTTLVSDRLSVGSYSYEWDASNLASGVYLYRLQVGDYVETRKMVLMR
jgi:hypothetical protein